MAQITIQTAVAVDDLFSGKLPVRTSKTVTYTSKHDVEKTITDTTAVTLWDPISDAVGATVFSALVFWTNATAGVDLEFGCGATSASVNFWSHRVVADLPFLLGDDGGFYNQTTTTGALTAASDFVNINRIRAVNPTTGTTVVVRLIMM